MQLLVLYYYNSDEDEEDAAADDFLELLRLFQSHNFGRKVRINKNAFLLSSEIFTKWAQSNTGVSNSNVYAGHILMKKELAGRTSRQKCLRGPQYEIKVL